MRTVFFFFFLHVVFLFPLGTPGRRRNDDLVLRAGPEEERAPAGAAV